ncbi:MAG: orotate phosphoribosyltransferase [Pseudomonadales bacterium]|nr:orotate phosphoribosyltransferase [Pseudomonadales bacterium]
MSAGSDMQVRRAALLDLAVDKGVLRFGEFELKSGRRSPYFFNAGHFDDAASMTALGDAYAATIVEAGLDFDVLFGPAYKGIPLAVATAGSLVRNHGVDCGIAYNRKEAKDHGEGGQTVGAPLAGRVVLVDDVITAGTAIRGVLPLIAGGGGTLSAVVTMLDRQERGIGQHSAIQELAAELSVPVISILTLEDLIGWLETTGRKEELARVAEYRERYGADG